MTGDCHVRFCESGRGRFPPATHPKNNGFAPGEVPQRRRWRGVLEVRGMEMSDEGDIRK
jgi:hypothetical protein